jgi:hypothetical protein
MTARDAAGSESSSLYDLAHQKANALSAMKDVSEELVSRLANAQEDDVKLAAALALFDTLDGHMKAVDKLDAQMAQLRKSGYVPQPREAVQLALEQGTIRALLKGIQALDERGIKLLDESKARLAGDMKEVKAGQKSLKAYATQQDEECAQVDTFR